MQFTNISIAFFSVVALTMVAPGPAYADDQMRGYLAPRSPAPEDGLRGQRMASEYTQNLLRRHTNCVAYACDDDDDCYAVNCERCHATLRKCTRPRIGRAVPKPKKAGKKN